MQIVDSSLPITARPPHEEPTPVTVAAASHVPGAFESVPVDQDRWEARVTKGRSADAAFAEQVRMLAMLGVMVGIGAGTVWIFLG